MAYRYPEFANVTAIRQEGRKRYCMEIELDPKGDKSLVVIQKNPSQANAEMSDHTINRVLNYLYRNRKGHPCLSGIRQVIFLNLIPWYETYSDRLQGKGRILSDPENLKTIERYLRTGDSCIIAWGNPPKGLVQPYAELSENVLEMLHRFGNSIYHVGALTRLGYPRHGQIWAYTDPIGNIK